MGGAIFASLLVAPLPEPLVYRVPPALKTQLTPGVSLEIPLGRRCTRGVLLSLLDTPPSSLPLEKLKEVPMQQPIPLFDAEQLSLIHWIAEYYGAPESLVADVVAPPVQPRFDLYYSLVNSLPSTSRAAPLQEKVMRMLQGGDPLVSRSAILEAIPTAGPVLKKLTTQGIISTQKRLVPPRLPSLEPGAAWAKREVTLNEEQTHAVETIAAARHRFHTFLLFGITGSGKTEVYLELARTVIAEGKAVLFLVPEIALTPQLIDRVRARFPAPVAVLHSGLSPRARFEAWQQLQSGGCRIALGARSAVFAPLPNLGLIIVDEEHDSSYKQSEGLRYHGRDLAIVRGKFANCPVVLGSATPALESYARAREGKEATLITMTGRHGASLPEVTVVDMGKVAPREHPAPHVSLELYRAIDAALAHHEQIFVLYNRRGFASYLECERCHETLACPNCSVSLTFHRSACVARCHHCDVVIPRPTQCPSCSSGPEGTSAELEERGAGTERIIDELVVLFPKARLERLDRDAARSMDEYQRILDRVRRREVDILVGTQMIAKGHDLPGVTVVGIADGDVGLHLPDFRASERVFQLITQAAGRAGRREQIGRVILQTRVPRHRVIVAAATHDFASFAEGELLSRRRYNYPPTARLMRILALSRAPAPGREALLQLRNLVEHRFPGLTFLGPAPAPLERLRAHFRSHLIVKAARARDLISLHQVGRQLAKNLHGVDLIFDMDPQDTL